jgi:4-hydroxythreonine-4-phosphate dehydrogenase
LNKALFGEVGLPVTGHTEILADRTEAPDHVMMLAGDTLRVALVTTHLPLSQVAAALSTEKILSTVRTTARDLRRLFGIKRPRIAVAALNPHAGELGNIGREEIEFITPAIDAARSEGIKARGPFAADTLFAKVNVEGEWPYDAVVCMYHDQALIPLKLVEFGRSANITLGLPIVRTSVDHGTAYDIAGKGTAETGSLRYALKVAAKLGARVIHSHT